MIIYDTMKFKNWQLTLFKDNDAIVFISFADDGVAEFSLQYPRMKLQYAKIPELRYFEQYLSGERVDFKSLNVAYLSGTPFQISVWHALHEVGKDEKLTYQQLAQRAGHPTAIRAVASAVGKNPLTIINPCHRILPKNGGVGQYHYGQALKKLLISLDDSETTQYF
ncbi:methylated-DNA--[protein]-cysteine S-methyltransferase [Leuconostoc citreum]|uniref:methylated-DNA--[protein]-cysteine S-methyltransferase n=1 Tax=Leuconostoc citreum TaxID=33964 RepID=UPI00218250E7|nr:methylated-DNA--[protein]-cysteine S-methyltransferase [Leuconostoc citreum]MCS8588103.1 methylated-DNA--[protein]-cysteine S-methyltransferase [Leuconostoc citreum]MCS8599842.1 methylated-DNA--[protein]-cysteine S-methyltransferase [Leuconostoc citreum]